MTTWGYHLFSFWNAFLIRPVVTPLVNFQGVAGLAQVETNITDGSHCLDMIRLHVILQVGFCVYLATCFALELVGVW